MLKFTPKLTCGKAPPDVPDWSKSQQPLLSPSISSTQHANKKMALTRAPPVPKWKADNSGSKAPQAPIDLSLVDDEAISRSRRGLSSESPEVVSSLPSKKVSSPIENGDADLLYEYFPLSIDDWSVYYEQESYVCCD